MLRPFRKFLESPLDFVKYEMGIHTYRLVTVLLLSIIVSYSIYIFHMQSDLLVKIENIEQSVIALPEAPFTGPAPPSGSQGAPVLLAAAILMIGIILLLWALQKNSLQHAIASSLYITLGLTLSFEPQIFENLFKFNINPSLDEIETLIAEMKLLDVNVSIHSNSNSFVQLDCNSEYTISPFLSGEHTELENQVVLTEKIDDLLDIIELRRGWDTIAAILLMGSTDRTPLSNEGKEIYSSNLGLAQARASYVKELLNQNLLGDLDAEPPQIVSLAVGPSFTVGFSDTQSGLISADRSVSICILHNVNN